LFGKLQEDFHFESPRKAKCSFVEYTGTSVFLYKFKRRDGTEIRSAVGAITDSQDTHYLLEILDDDLLTKGNFEEFTARLMQNAGGHRKIVFDGLRPVEVALLLKARIRHVAIIFVEAAEQKRKERLAELNARNGATIDFDNEFRALMSHPIEQTVLRMKGIADVVVDNNADKDDLRERLTIAVSALEEAWKSQNHR
jgi:dephospho-CoA kinase